MPARRTTTELNQPSFENLLAAITIANNGASRKLTANSVRGGLWLMSVFPEIFSLHISAGQTVRTEGRTKVACLTISRRIGQAGRDRDFTHAIAAQEQITTPRPWGVVEIDYATPQDRRDAIGRALGLFQDSETTDQSGWIDEIRFRIPRCPSVDTQWSVPPSSIFRRVLGDPYVPMTAEISERVSRYLPSPLESVNGDQLLQYWQENHQIMSAQNERDRQSALARRAQVQAVVAAPPTDGRAMAYVDDYIDAVQNATVRLSTAVSSIGYDFARHMESAMNDRRDGSGSDVMQKISRAVAQQMMLMTLFPLLRSTLMKVGYLSRNGLIVKLYRDYPTAPIQASVQTPSGNINRSTVWPNAGPHGAHVTIQLFAQGTSSVGTAEELDFFAATNTLPGSSEMPDNFVSSTGLADRLAGLSPLDLLTNVYAVDLDRNGQRGEARIDTRTGWGSNTEITLRQNAMIGPHVNPFPLSMRSWSSTGSMSGQLSAAIAQVQAHIGHHLEAQYGSRYTELNMGAIAHFLAQMRWLRTKTLSPDFGIFIPSIQNRIGPVLVASARRDGPPSIVVGTLRSPYLLGRFEPDDARRYLFDGTTESLSFFRGQAHRIGADPIPEIDASGGRYVPGVGQALTTRRLSETLVASGDFTVMNAEDELRYFFGRGESLYGRPHVAMHTRNMYAYMAGSVSVDTLLTTPYTHIPLAPAALVSTNAELGNTTILTRLGWVVEKEGDDYVAKSATDSRALIRASARAGLAEAELLEALALEVVSHSLL